MLLIVLFSVFNERFLELVFAPDIQMLPTSGKSGTRVVMLRRSCLCSTLKSAPSSEAKDFRQQNDIITCPSACPRCPAQFTFLRPFSLAGLPAAPLASLAPVVFDLTRAGIDDFLLSTVKIGFGVSTFFFGKTAIFEARAIVFRRGIPFPRLPLPFTSCFPREDPMLSQLSFLLIAGGIRLLHLVVSLSGVRGVQGGVSILVGGRLMNAALVLTGGGALSEAPWRPLQTPPRTLPIRELTCLGNVNDSTFPVDFLTPSPRPSLSLNPSLFCILAISAKLGLLYRDDF